MEERRDNLEHYSTLRFFWLDTSAIVKLFIKEQGSDVISEVFSHRPGDNFYSTEYCIYEFFNVLKRKLTNECFPLENYLRAIFILQSHVRSRALKLYSFDSNYVQLFNDTRDIIRKYSLDYTDAIQFVLMKQGFLSGLAGESKPVLVSSDKDMVKAAKSENIRTWNPEEGPFLD